MCYIFSCFGWALDFLQRTLTFILACILCFIITIGILVAIAAGVAYGYNYSMAEFLTFTRQDTTVYMRRGQFYDKPDFDTDKDVVYARRSGDVTGVANNLSMDYNSEDTESLRRNLPNSWGQVQDTRRYAEVLTKFSRKPEMEESILSDDELTRAIPAPPPQSPPPPVPVPKRISIAPYPSMIATTLMESGASHIMMRNFKPPSATERRPASSFPGLEMAVSLQRVARMTGRNKRDILLGGAPRKRLCSAVYCNTLIVLNSAEESGFDESDRYSAGNALYSDEEQDRRTKFFQLHQARSTTPIMPAALPPIAVDHKSEKLEKISSHVPMRHWAASKAPMRPETYLDYKEDIDEENVVYKPI